MIAYWLALGFSGIVFALAVSFAFWPMDPRKFDERQIRVYRLTLEGRRPPVGHIFIISLGLLWLIIAIEEIFSGSPIGFAYLIPAILFLTSIWLYRRYRIKTLRMLGNRGLVPRAASEERAGFWYRLWGTVSVFGWVGPSVMEFNYQQSFETGDPFKDGASTVHSLLSMCLIIGVTGLLITYLITRAREQKQPDGPVS